MKGTGSAVRQSHYQHGLAAALLVALLSAPSRAAEPGPEELYRRGSQAYRDGRYEESARDLARAEALEPHAELAYDLARAWERAGDGRAAIDAYREYLRLAPDAADRVDVEARVRELEAQLAPVAPAAPAPVVEAATPSRASVAPIASSEARPRRSAFQRIRLPTYIAFGAGAAGLGAALGFALAQQHEEDAVRGAPTQLDARAAYHAAALDRDWARVLVGIGAAGVLTGAALLALDLTRHGDAVNGSSGSRIQVSLGPLGASVKGIF